MKPARLTEAPDNAGLNPDTMKVSKWYQETTRKNDVPHFSLSSRMSDVVNGTEGLHTKPESLLKMKKGLLWRKWHASSIAKASF